VTSKDTAARKAISANEAVKYDVSIWIITFFKERVLVSLTFESFKHVKHLSSYKDETFLMSVR
jgi:hypothetical protein